MRRRMAPWIAFLLAFSVTLMPASAHSTGGDLSANGSFVLTPSGTVNDTMHDSLESMGVPVHKGDTFYFDWAVNGGSGPAVRFNIHSHSQANAMEIHYEAEDVEHHGTWVAPVELMYLVVWENPTNLTVTVAYAFGVDFAPNNLCGLVALGILAVVGVGAAVLLLMKRREKESYDGEASRSKS